MSRNRVKTQEGFDAENWYTLVESKRLAHYDINYLELKKFAENLEINISTISENDFRNSKRLDIQKLNKNKITDKIFNTIIEKLDKFEKNRHFLKSDITLFSLSHNLKTNSKYLSKTINIYKKKTFTQYINDLRIEYLIEKLNTDKTFKNYTIQAIATEIGFNTPNAFSRAFFKKTGMYPSEYIKELDS